ncbi:MAG: polysaccharide deacetylase family protein [Clostridiales bacterium]|jgi:peptidoglycan/xylan/chitin deacetylase (PgdA/CDA1 family)|nr:polysaccharide deacetylase family protein [Clostridiales bacterium]
MRKTAGNAIGILSAIVLAVNLVFVTTKSEGTADVRVPVILYHNIVDSLAGQDLLVSITPDTFRAHMTALKNAGYTGITFDEYYDYVNGGGGLPEKPVIITLDDGYLSNYQYAWPILRSLGMKATIFIVTSTVGASTGVSYPHFTWEQAREMEQSGVIDIQSHSHSHEEIPAMDDAAVVRELRLSKYLIEENLGKECRYFAYPYGMYDERALSAASAAGYRLQCLLGNSGYNTKDTPAEKLRRITVWGDRSGESLAELVEETVRGNPFGEPEEIVQEEFVQDETEESPGSE